MKEEIPLMISLPFSWWRREGIFPKKELVSSYRAALMREIRSLGEDLPEACLSSLHFEGGYLGLFSMDDLLELLSCIRGAFSVKEGAPLTGTLFPGSLDMALLSAYQSQHAGPLFFEVPSLLMRECERLNLPNVLQLLSHTRYLLASYRFPDWGLALAGDIPERGEAAWEHIGREILSLQPAHVRFDRFQRAEAFAPCEDLLRKGGYRPLKENFYTRAQLPPHFLFPEEYLGAGLGAGTRMQGFLTRNTPDLGRYLNSSANYRNLLVLVQEKT